MPESGTSGSVRDRVGKPPGLLDRVFFREAYLGSLQQQRASRTVASRALPRDGGIAMRCALTTAVSPLSP
jgi:hypothetical protein